MADDSSSTRYNKPPRTADPFIEEIWHELSLKRRMAYYVAMDKDSETEPETQAVIEMVRKRKQGRDKSPDQNETRNTNKRARTDAIATSSSNFTSTRPAAQQQNPQGQSSAKDKGKQSTVSTHRISWANSGEVQAEDEQQSIVGGHAGGRNSRQPSEGPEDRQEISPDSPNRSSPVDSTPSGGGGSSSSKNQGRGGPLVAARGRNLKRANARSGRKVETVIKPPLFDLAKAPLASLTPHLKELRTYCLDTVRLFLKEVTGIETTKKKKKGRTSPLLPGPPEPGDPPRLSPSGFAYMTPHFDEDVRSVVNRSIIMKAAELALAEIQKSPGEIIELTEHNVPVRMKLLVDFAKTTFRGWADKYQGQVDSTKKKMLKNNQKTARRARRREEQFRRRTWAVKRFESVYSFDPSPMLHADWMSDEESGPDADDSDTEESHDDWLKRMDTYLGVKRGLDGKRLVTFEVLQVVEPAWRTDWVSGVLHELSRIHYSSLSQTERKSYRYQRVKNSGKLKDEPSFTVPFNFMVDAPWWKKVKDEGLYEEYLDGWMTRYEDPPAFKELPKFEPVYTLPEFDDEDEEEYEADVE